MVRKRKAEVVPLYECDICRCRPLPHNPSHIARHVSGIKHVRLEELVEKRGILQSWGIQFVGGTSIKYVCTTCDLDMELSFEKMEQHFKSQHVLPLQASQIPTVEVSKVYRRKAWYERDINFDEGRVKYTDLNGSTMMEESRVRKERLTRTRAEVVPLYECDICRCPPLPNNPSHIARHVAGAKHVRLEELVEKRGILESWGIEFVGGTGIKYVCTTCELDMELSFEKMKQHFKSQHVLPLQASQIPTVEVSKVYRRKTYYEKDYDFDEDRVNYTDLNGSISMEECSPLSTNCVGILRMDLIPADCIPRLYRMASTLERHGKGTDRGKKIAGSRMTMYGMFENHQLGWFVHPDPGMYALSEAFVRNMCAHFQVAFPKVMEKLEKILVKEGLNGTDGRFGGSPFTCFSITRDYFCAPHDDPTDYGYGFIVWLHPTGEVEVQDQPSLWLPQYQVRLRGSNGAGVILNGNTTVHCTTAPKAGVGVLGMAFVQKRPFIVQLSKALKNPTDVVAINYFKSKDRYMSRRDTNIGAGAATPFY